MKLTIIVATADLQVQAFVGQQKQAIIPDGIVQRFRRPLKIAVFAFQLSPATSDDDVTDYLVGLKGSADAVVILVDGRYEEMFSRYQDAFFISSYSPALGGKSMKNFFSMVLAKVLRNFAVLSQRFDDAKFQKVLLLPLHIFEADELAETRALVHRDTRRDDFPTMLDQCLGALRRRQTPKTRAKGKKVYLKDDADRFFEYGLERHARIETTSPPHARFCDLNASFRFGRAYESDRHFNVSRSGEQSSGKLASCHLQEVGFRRRSHLNIFPNGFFK